MARLLFYTQFVHARDLVFDIGANLGNRTKVFHHLGARVVAIEPQPRLTRALRTVYAHDETVTIVESAVGSKVGESEILMAGVHSVSSLSMEWIQNVRASGRFENIAWSDTIAVPLTTLDQLIATYGQPTFIKIDVEGYELDVLLGLHAPVTALSFEFTPEMSSTACSCVSYLDNLGMGEFNFVEGESLTLISEKWMTSRELKHVLERYHSSNRIFGDVYARHPDTP